MARLKKDKVRPPYILPSLFTTANLFCGFYALVATVEGNYFRAAVAILVAMVFDILDGRVARLTGTVSRFGVEYDSLCDLISFGLSPAFLAYAFALKSYGRYGWLACFLYVATAALRLARFNVQASSAARAYFTGLPSPAAAGLVATTVLFSLWMGIEPPVQHLAILAMVYILSYLMVSNIPYFSFKRVSWAERHPFYSLVAFVLIFTVVAAEPPLMLFLVFLFYALSGPFLLALRSWRRERVPVSEKTF
jgi:CDP-diacylglycerol--serine O-phosphatidyltransferase